MAYLTHTPGATNVEVLELGHVDAITARINADGSIEGTGAKPEDITSVANRIKWYQKTWQTDAVVIDGANKQAVAEMEPEQLGEEFLLDPEDVWPSLDTPEKANDYALVHKLTTPEQSAKFPVGEVGAVGTTDVAAMGYYLVKWLSEPYTLQEETERMAGLIGTGKMVADAVYFNRVQCAPYWYTLSGEHTIVEVRHVLRTGLHLHPISVANKLPVACNRMDATQQKALKVTHLDHDAIMEEASRRDRLEYDDDEDDESEEEESDDKLAESDGDSE
jgi:hypothetical protein